MAASDLTSKTHACVPTLDIVVRPTWQFGEGIKQSHRHIHNKCKTGTQAQANLIQALESKVRSTLSQGKGVVFQSLQSVDALHTASNIVQRTMPDKEELN